MHSDNSVDSDHAFPDGVGSLELNGRAAGSGGGGSSPKVTGLVAFGKDSDHGLGGGGDVPGGREAVQIDVGSILVQMGSQGGEVPGRDAAGGPEGETGEAGEGSYEQRFEVIGRKCGCGVVWCPRCRMGVSASRIGKAMERFDWARTRHVTLTVDPRDWEGPQDAFHALTDGKALYQFVRDLRRSHGVHVTDYWWCLEWHRNGFPHWHVLVEVSEAGRSGMIGGEVLRRCWKHGRVHEAYYRTERHWNRFSGYASKVGYLEKKKAHQAILPSWAQGLKTGSIRKMGGMTEASRRKYKLTTTEGDSPVHKQGESPKTDRQPDSEPSGSAYGISDDWLLKMDPSLIKKLDHEYDTGGALMVRYHHLMGWDDCEPEEQFVLWPQYSVGFCQSSVANR